MGIFLEDSDIGPLPEISQCSTLQTGTKDIRFTDDDVSKISGRESLMPWHTNHTSMSIRSSLELMQNVTNTEPSNSHGTSFLPPVERLRESLRGACVSQDRYNTRMYIPEDKQSEIITEYNVSATLKHATVTSHGEGLQSLVDQVIPPDLAPGSAQAIESRSRQKLFAILIMLGVPEKIHTFIRDNIWDSHLPLHRNLVEKRWECYDNVNGDKVLKIARFMDHIRDPHSHLEDLLEDLFEKYQWYMIAPVFDLSGPELMHYSLLKNTPLPFIEDRPGGEHPVRGGFGEVRRVRIHPAHHTLRSEEGSFAVKRLNSNSESEFNQEVNALRLFRDQGDPHLIKLLATYHDGDYYNLIFRWANGNLHDLWQRIPNPEKSHRRSMWITEQCLGLAEALRKIHCHEFPGANSSRSGRPRMIGRHGDIKPENILCFPSSYGNSDDEHGVLALSDFGLTRFHRASTAFRQYEMNSLAVSPTYRAPECDLMGEISPSWDIWALGCVYLEFLIWYLQGCTAIEEFSRQRKACDTSVNGKEDKYFSGDKRWRFGAHRKLIVIQRIEELHNHSSCTEFIHELLDLISNGMIRVRSQQRMESAEISRKLQKMLQRSRDYQSYCAEPRPRVSKKMTNKSDKKQPVLKKFLNLVGIAKT
ncbi:kinase-like domain-containing protein [Xylaria arbuscula]|nr:kinase-like domain-containing protein [Xylaria arbuscula]